MFSQGKLAQYIKIPYTPYENGVGGEERENREKGVFFFYPDFHSFWI